MRSLILWTIYVPIASLVLRNHPDVPHKLAPDVSLVSIAMIVVEIMIVLSPLRSGQKWALWAAAIPFVVVGIPRLISDPACQLSDLHHHGCHQFMGAMFLGAIGWILSLLGIFGKPAKHERFM
ncbi:MAG TPA: hypothetical protein VHA33_12865 [Candidatus Angelobacter sp.]|nr:hypothetical protein [Candidatus Angelobacter sp.]